MAVGIEPEAMPEGCFPRELFFGYTLEVVDEPAVGFIQFPQYLGERKTPFQFRHLSIEGIDASILYRVPGWLSSLHDKRQIL